MITKEQVSNRIVAAVEDKVGRSSAGWDLLDPKEIIAAALNYAHLAVEITSCGFEFEAGADVEQGGDDPLVDLPPMDQPFV